MRLEVKIRLGILTILALTLWATVAKGGELDGTETRRFRVTFYCSDRACTGRHSPQAGGSGNTAMGNVPLPFKTVAVGDPALRGSWIYFEDLGGWVYASDTGKPCPPDRKGRKRPACVARDQVDVFVGGPHMHKWAVKLGVMEWWGSVAPRRLE